MLHVLNKNPEFAVPFIFKVKYRRQNQIVRRIIHSFLNYFKLLCLAIATNVAATIIISLSPKILPYSRHRATMKYASNIGKSWSTKQFDQSIPIDQTMIWQGHDFIWSICKRTKCLFSSTEWNLFVKFSSIRWNLFNKLAMN